jgi:hypothetical protein
VYILIIDQLFEFAYACERPVASIANREYDGNRNCGLVALQRLAMQPRVIPVNSIQRLVTTAPCNHLFDWMIDNEHIYAVDSPFQIVYRELEGVIQLSSSDEEDMDETGDYI